MKSKHEDLKKQNFYLILFISQELNIKSRITEGFIERFQLKPDELNALRTTRDGFLHPVRKNSCFIFYILIKFL